ncbi:MAG: MBL fold metallo-hydrolase [Actinobacteria bacterium]|nr:MBL fold metallo-hydrolase [Actinomycetota bacterium]
MRVTVLGSSASYAGPGQACSGYLVEHADVRVLMDCGNGVVANLAAVADPTTLDAVFITHEHPDHFLDIYALAALLRYAPQGPLAPLALWLPPGLFERMGCLLSERGRDELAEAFVVHELTAEKPVRFGELTITPHLVEHVDPTFALIAEGPGGTRVCYTSDTAPGPAALAAARGASLLIAEATLPQRYQGRAAHLTAAQAGELAREAQVEHLILSHIWPTNDKAAMLREAEAAFGGKVSIATEFDAYDLEEGDTP